LKIVFMGTPQFAVPVLEALVKAGHEVRLVVTQPDRPKGRSKKPVPPPVKALAQTLSLPVFQPERVRRPEAIEEIRKASPDALVVAAFGQILPKALLEIPRLGNFNVHASLLPKYRGAAPINWAIVNGEAETGITIMLMDEGMDTGAMLATACEPILPEDTAETLTAKLSRVGAELIVKALSEFEAGMLKPVSQDNYQATYAPILKKGMGKIDWAKPAVEIERMVRGLDPWPGAFTYLTGKMLHIWKAAVAPPAQSPQASHPLPSTGEGRGEGEVISACKDGIIVAAGEGALIIEELQPEGGRRMKATEYLAGHKIAPGEILG
jgi:methionyl-tRNA formyltransferase